jgi:hypothetical protein
MGGRTRIGFHIFMLGVLVLLARPYLAYRLTAARDMTPARASSLLQRLVKKKDDHHEDQANAGSAMLSSKTAVRPMRRLPASPVIFLLTLFYPFVQAAKGIPALFPFVRRQRYRLTSCLLI